MSYIKNIMILLFKNSNFFNIIIKVKINNNFKQIYKIKSQKANFILQKAYFF